MKLATRSFSSRHLGTALAGLLAACSSAACSSSDNAGDELGLGADASASTSGASAEASMSSAGNEDASASGSATGSEGGASSPMDASVAASDAATRGDTSVANANDAQLEAGASGDAGDSAADASTSSCPRCTGPGDWRAGDYPPDLHAQTYLAIKGVKGQGESVRGYKVHVPPSYDPARGMPMLFALHGLGQNGVMFAVDGANWPAKSDKEGFILVMPTGIAQNADGSWDGAGSWNAGECCGGAASSGVDDVALIRAIAEEVGKHLNVDRARVYATGLSNGGFLSYRLACEAADLFTAVAPGAGAIGTPMLAPLGVGNEMFTTCTPSQPISVLAMHGTADPLVPYSYMKPSLDHMAMAAGCMASTGPATLPKSSGDTTCITYAGCPAGVEVTGCSVMNGGHCWFGDKTCGTGDTTGVGTLIVGANSDTLVSTEAAWEFLRRFSR